MIQLQYKISTEVNLKHLKYLVNHNLKCSTKLVNKNIKLCCQRTHIPWLPANIKLKAMAGLSDNIFQLLEQICLHGETSSR